MRVLSKQDWKILWFRCVLLQSHCNVQCTHNCRRCFIEKIITMWYLCFLPKNSLELQQQFKFSLERKQSVSKCIKNYKISWSNNFNWPVCHLALRFIYFLSWIFGDSKFIDVCYELIASEYNKFRWFSFMVTVL